MSAKTENIEILAERVRRRARRLPADQVAALVDNIGPLMSASVIDSFVRAIERTKGSGSDPGERLASLLDALVEVRLDTARRDAAHGAAGRRLGRGRGEYLNVEEAVAVRDRLVRPIEPEDGVSSDEAARIMRLAKRQSVLDRFRRNELIGFSGPRRGVRFPRAQFDERGRPPPGLASVLEVHGDHYAVWTWLTAPSNLLEGDVPLDRLRAGDGDAVVAALRSEREGAFG